MQLTWLENYQKAWEKLSVNLVKFPMAAPVVKQGLLAWLLSKPFPNRKGA